MEFIFIIFLIVISSLAIDAVIYFAAGFFPYIGKVVVRTLVIDSIIGRFEFLVSFFLYGSGIGFDSFYYYLILVIIYSSFLIVNSYAVYLLYKDYKKRKQVSSDSMDIEFLENGNKVEKKANDNSYEWIIFIGCFVFVIISSKNILFSNYSVDLISEKLSLRSLLLSIVFSIVLGFMWLIAVKRLKNRKITYPILYLVITIIVVMILGVFIEFDIVQLIYVYSLIFNIAVAIVLFLYFYDKDKNV